MHHPLTVVCLADTHGWHHALRVPCGDVLIHAGDLTRLGSLEEVQEGLAWLAALPHRHKILVAGNHDFLFERDPESARALVPDGVTYLQNSGTTVEGLRIWGAPWVPEFGGWAFETPPAIMRAHWSLIPQDTHILVTHTPPAGVLDLNDGIEHAGCPHLAVRVRQLANLRLHVCGHIHEGRGIVTLGTTTWVNAFPPPVVIRLEG